MNEPLVSFLFVRGKERRGEGFVPKQDKYFIISARYSAEEAAELQKDTAVSQLFLCLIRKIMQYSDRLRLS